MGKVNKKLVIFHISTIILGILGIVLMATVDVIAVKHPIFRIGSYTLPPSSLNGLFLMITFLACIFMTIFVYPRGATSAYVIIGVFLFTTITAIVRKHSLSALPGVAGGVLTVFSVYVLNSYIKESKKKILTDYTTGLYNLRGFFEMLETMMNKGRKGSLAYLQFNNIREINDEYGHETGDSVLYEIGKRLENVVGRNGIVSRIGGTEFSIIIYNYADPQSVLYAVKKAMSDVIYITYNEQKLYFYVEFNAGVAQFPQDAYEKDTIIKCADIALMHSENKGPGTITFFDREMENEMVRVHEMEAIIKDALANDYFYLVYQPQYKAEDKSLRGFETLIRLRTPEGREIYPGEFIPIAEKTGLISSIDKYVLDKATKEFSDIILKSKEKIMLSVNVSAGSISHKTFASNVLNTISENHFPPSSLEIEITEYSFAESTEKTIANLEELNKHGIQIALDDFGTGYTSLSQVLHLPINILKVDKSFIDDIEKSEVSRDFLSIIAYMGHITNCEVIAEGVETASQLDIIKELECDIVQGFVWSKPMSYDKAIEEM